MAFTRAELGVEPAKYFSKSNERKEPINELRFGDVFITSYRIPALPETLEKCIALEISENGSLDAHNIIIDENGQELIHPLGGSENVDNIFEIVDHWDSDRVIEACKKGWKLLMGNELPQDLIEMLNKEKVKPPYKAKHEIDRSKSPPSPRQSH